MGIEPDNSNIYGLDRWLNHSLWWDGDLEAMSREEIAAQIDAMNFSQPLIYTGAGHDPDSGLIATLASVTTFDKDTGVFEDKIIYWNNEPWSNEKELENADKYVLAIRGRVNPNQTEGEVPEILPDLIYVNGKKIFGGTVYGSGMSPFEPKRRVEIERAFSLTNRIKAALANHTPLLDMSKVMAGGRHDQNIVEAAFGTSIDLPGLDNKGGVKSAFNAFFMRNWVGENAAVNNPRFVLKPIKDSAGRVLMDPHTRLKVMHGYHINTREPLRSSEKSPVMSDVQWETGIRHEVLPKFEVDEASGQARFEVSSRARDVPEGMKVAANKQLVDLRYRLSDECVFEAEHANFDSGNPNDFRPRDMLGSVIGLTQDIMLSKAKRQYPPVLDQITKNRLHDYLSDKRPPPGEDVGGECMVYFTDGCGLEKTIGPSGAGIGGGVVFQSRVRKNNGRISNVALIHDVSWETLATNSGAQADLRKLIDENEEVVIALSHKHFDHKSIQYLAQQGLLKGVKILCNDRLWDRVYKDLKKVGVRLDDFPVHIGYDHPDVTKVDKHSYAYAVKDADGVNRLWAMQCENAVKHTAMTDSLLVQPCYGDDHYKPAHLVPSDNYGFTKHGKKFARHGPLALARHPEVSLSKLRRSLPSVKDKYITWMEATNTSKSGSVEGQEEKFKETVRAVLDLYTDKVVVFANFSTNDMEAQLVHEVLAEEKYLRHSVSLGSNYKEADSSRNNHGVTWEIDLRETEIPKDKLPQSAFDLAFEAMENYIDQAETDAQIRAEESQSGVTADKILQDNQPYQVVRHVLQEARRQQLYGDAKPQAIFDAFLNGNENAFEDIAGKIGLPERDENEEPRAMPKIVKNAIEERRVEIRDALQAQGVNQYSDTEYWMLFKIAQRGEVFFKTKNSIEEKNMYEAIMRGQKRASLHAGHESDKGKDFRAEPSELAIFMTGAIGSVEEFEAALPKFVRGVGPLHTRDEIDPVAGYYIDNEIVVIDLQPPSMGKDKAYDQRKLINALNDRGVPSVFSREEGITFYNPQDKRPEILEKFSNHQGAIIDHHHEANAIEVGNITGHVSGHGHEGDNKKQVEEHLYSNMIGPMHIGSVAALRGLGDLVKGAGKRMVTEDPHNFVPYVFKHNLAARRFEVEVQPWLAERRSIINEHRPFGQMYGGDIEISHHILWRAGGDDLHKDLRVTTDDDGHYAANTASMLSGDFNDAGDSFSPRRGKLGPAAADMMDVSSCNQGRAGMPAIKRMRKGFYSRPEPGGGGS